MALRTITPHDTRHPHTQSRERGGTREDHQGPASRGSPRTISGGLRWACSIARTVGSFVGTLAADRQRRMLRADRDVLLCNTLVNKHLANVRFGRCPLPAPSGVGPQPCSTSLSHGLTRSVALCKNLVTPLAENRLKRNPPGVGRTEVVAPSVKLENSGISARGVLGGDRAGWGVGMM